MIDEEATKPHSTNPQPNLYTGALLFSELLGHERNSQGATSEASSASRRMREFADRMLYAECEECPAEALYQIAIWVLLEEPGYFDDEKDVARLLGTAARGGYEAAMFVLSKATIERVWWAEDELRHIAKDGNATKLAGEWLRNLASEGYADAKVEYAGVLWGAGLREEALAQLDAIPADFPEGRIRKGLYLLASDPPNGIGLIDEGEQLAEKFGNPLAQLSETLRGRW